MIYHSKKDAWFVLVMGIGMAVPLVIGIVTMFAVKDSSAAKLGWLLVGSGLLIAALFFWLSNPLYYEITSSTLIVRSGPLRWNIAIEDIENVYPTNNPISSPAMSLDRLRIEYRKAGASAFVLISPADKTAFLHDLALAAPRLRLSGDRLIMPSR